MTERLCCSPNGFGTQRYLFMSVLTREYVDWTIKHIKEATGRKVELVWIPGSTTY